MRRGALLAWFVIGLAACNAIAGLDGDFVEGDAGTKPSASSSGSNGVTSSTSSTGGEGSTSSGGTSTSGGTTSSSGSTSSSTSSSSSSTSSSTSSTGGIDAGKDSGPTLQFCDRPEDKPWDFCWNFNGTETGPKWGAFEAYAKGAAPAVEPNVSGTEKGALHAANSTDFGSTGLVWNVPTGDNTKHKRVLEFRFRAVSINYYAAIGVFQMNNTEHGLAVSTKCPSSTSPCFIENQPDSAQNPRAASNASIPADTNWHSGLVSMTYSPANNLWSGEVRVDNVVITSRSDAIPANGQASTYQVVAGAFFGGANAGAKTNEVYVDNLRVHLE